MIFDDLAARYPGESTYLAIPQVRAGGAHSLREDPTGPLAPVTPRPPGLEVLVPYGPGADAELVEDTGNGLQPDDLDLPQPPQDPTWVPS